MELDSQASATVGGTSVASAVRLDLVRRLGPQLAVLSLSVSFPMWVAHFLPVVKSVASELSDRWMWGVHVLGVAWCLLMAGAHPRLKWPAWWGAVGLVAMLVDDQLWAFPFAKTLMSAQVKVFSLSARLLHWLPVVWQAWVLRSILGVKGRVAVWWAAAAISTLQAVWWVFATDEWLLFAPRPVAWGLVAASWWFAVGRELPATSVPARASADLAEAVGWLRQAVLTAVLLPVALIAASFFFSAWVAGLMAVCAALAAVVLWAFGAFATLGRAGSRDSSEWMLGAVALGAWGGGAQVSLTYLRTWPSDSWVTWLVRAASVGATVLVLQWFSRVCAEARRTDLSVSPWVAVLMVCGEGLLASGPPVRSVTFLLGVALGLVVPLLLLRGLGQLATALQREHDARTSSN